MSDLITRLRTMSATGWHPIGNEAADEIDRLRAAVQHEADCVEAAKAEIDRLRQWETCAREWLDKTEWVQEAAKTSPVSWLGKHRADIMRDEIDRLTRELAELSDEVALKSACINGMSQATDKLAGERNEARAERNALAKDAARYRRVRRDPSMLLHLSNTDFDATIDAQIEQEQPK